MSSSHRNEPVEFIGEMPDEYEDEEYYGEEEDYADDGGSEDYDEDEEEEAPAARGGKPKGSIVRTALFGVGGLAMVLGIAYGAMTMFAPDTLNDIVNNLPFVAHNDQPSPDTNATAGGPKAGGAKAGGNNGGTDVAAVPPDPAKAGAMKNARKGADDNGGEPGASGAAPGGTVARAPRAPRMPKPAGKMAANPGGSNAEPMEGVPMEGAPPAKPAHKAPKVAHKVKPAAKPAAVAAKPMTTHAKIKPHTKMNAVKMAEARAIWLKRHPHKGAASTVVASRGAFLGWGSRIVWVHGRRRRQWVPLYAVVTHRTGVYPLATAHSMAALPASWKHGPAGRYAVQIGAFSRAANASQLVSQLRAQGIAAYTAPGKGRSRVFIGNYGSRTAAAVKMQQLQAQGIPAAVTNY